MGKRALENRIKKLKELEGQQKLIEKEMDALKEEIKKEMELEGTEELNTGNFIIRWKTIISNKFDSKTFQKEHEVLYNQYMKKTSSKRFTIA